MRSHYRFRAGEIISYKRKVSAAVLAWREWHATLCAVRFVHQCTERIACHTPWRPRNPEIAMGKYVFAWVLGVPAGLLALIYVLAHL